MKLIEAINRTDYSKPNNLTTEQKIELISRLDAQVKANVIDVHENAKTGEFKPYTADDMSKDLLIEFPYDDIYQLYLAAQIDLANNEYERYSISSTVFNKAFNEYERAYNRENMPISREFRFF